MPRYAFFLFFFFTPVLMQEKRECMIHVAIALPEAVYFSVVLGNARVSKMRLGRPPVDGT